MSAIQQLLTDHLDIWTAADTEKKSGRGRSSGNAGSVYGIKKLRELILELAVRGKLVPQDENDEPASELLKRIVAEKAKLIAEGKIKKSKPLAEITDDEKPFELPVGWEWVRVNTIGHDWGQKTPDVDFTYIEVSAIDSKIGIVSTPQLVEFENAPSRARKIVKAGTVIYSTVRPYLLNIAVIEQEFIPEPIASTAFAIVHPFCSMPPRYFLFFFRSPIFVRYVESVQMGIAYPAINDGQFFSGLLPLPPLAEQHRIVAKVDELMALCDQLENQHNNAAEAHEKLVTHLLGTLTQSQNAEDFNTHWQRISEHFDTLFTTEASIDALKQTLLQLAVMGKLVPQDPNDEPASELLKRIQAEKTKLIAEGKIKKDKPLAEITEEEKPFDLPVGWEWVRLADLLAVLTDGDHQAPPKANSGVPFLVIGNLNKGKVSLDGCRYVPDEYYEKLDWIKKPTKNDLLYTVTGSYGIPIKVNVSNKFCVQRHVAILKRVESTPISYLSFLLKSEYALQYATAIATGIAQKTVPLTGLRLMPIAVPPEIEQQRIVAKVDELMVICDQLKARINSSNQLQQKLADVMIDKTVN
jgi:type I restriction enzyme S subunit